MSLGAYGDGRSMKGSGIYREDVSYDEFTCEYEECGKHNEAGDTSADDWGDYDINCQFCGNTYMSGNLREDAESAAADAAYDDWKHSR